MEIIEVFAPARVDLAGGTLDIFPIYLFFENPFTLNSTLSKGVRVFFRKRKGRILLKNANSGVSEFFPSYHKDLSLVTALLEYLKIESGFEIEFYSDFPKGSSLGVSSSLLVAVLYGLNKLFNLRFSRKKSVEILKNIETRFMGYPAGLQDYLAPLYGGLNAFYFGVEGFTRKKINLDKRFRKNFIFVYTGKSHFSGAPNWELFKGFFDKEKTILSGFQLIYENSKKVLQVIENKDIKLLGKLLKDDFETRKHMLSSLVPKVDLFDILDNSKGVLGYRLCGAASGGTAVVCVESGRADFVKAFLKDRGYTVFDCLLENKRVAARYV